MSPTTHSFITGVIAALYGVAGLFFLSFWRRTRDGLFVAFALAFGLLALSQTLLALAGLEREEQSWVYLIRLLAFLLIIAGIVRKNLEGRRR
ncbi:DUF5985 family protein [Azospirillum picis]|uniref:Uncharacterized membrane protein HdeD (DUF308 family) n=1 Tax=Azospirillum picis TaxID=488438 RepID=A0ABU0MLT9_9PROT|nr:DUF5985 family protein [Azospirillum picis]MBP2300945.1 uncharacterized membrane protein HdeD (DUF308 family) [Azospirillum picis]MDQ0534435.1 uncharacterized membrane protein HdeD (DUF308 family) [Azospirillum picis]